MTAHKEIAFALNPRSRAGALDIALTRRFSPAVADKVRKFHRRFPQYKPTPLVPLSHLSRSWGVSRVWVKDESKRFGLKAFKVLGAAYALATLMAEQFGIEPEELFSGHLTSLPVKKGGLPPTFVTATDGNHGRAVAWAAQRLGTRAVVYMPKGSSRARYDAIRSHGAETTIIDGNYDDAVHLAAEQAQKQEAYVLIQDTALPGYQDVPARIMQGYLTIVDESLEQLEGERPTHLFVQCGVGSLAASQQAYLVERFGRKRPLFVVVEAEQAACYFKSIVEGLGRPQKIEGDLQTLMAGLACGEPNALAWEILSRYGDIFVACKDSVAVKGMRLLGNPLPGDEDIVSGESGAVTTGLLATILAQPLNEELRDAFRMDERTKVLLISTEGDTDPATYRKIMMEKNF
jgi:diaminopropionate ammonia-lyase